MKYFYLIKLIILLILFPYIFNKEQISLYSSSSSLLSLVSGLTANFHCSVRRCTKIIINKDFQSISWYHEGILLFNGTEFEPTSGIEPSRIILQHSLEEIRNEEENNEEGSSCIVEEYSLLLRNLSQEDSGKYSCSINGRNSQQLDFNLNVLGDNSLKLNFPSNLTYDHTECCIERGVSPICRPMCRPRNIGEEFFDPTRYII
ncbi:Ig-like domain-containing protein [Meloidogyne graminicola]|uniref:Ig-like domain-containing protein n=1 Tax=Meloidogyne graminicola TaxID=189291 RepID=A0A8S9ZY27_9BILA|nr:Ig-like domain-containing protein [Meloidogyne graminicola]